MGKTLYTPDFFRQLNNLVNRVTRIESVVSKNTENIHTNTPAGIILPFGGYESPSGYLICDGSEIKIEDFPNLFSVINTIYGTGDGSTTFNLPDLRGRAIYGYNINNADLNSLGKNDGVAVSNRKPKHKHGPGNLTTGTPTNWPSFNVYSAGGATNFVVHTWGGSNIGGDANKYNDLSHTHAVTGGTTGDTSSSMQDTAPYLALNYIIKY